MILLSFGTAEVPNVCNTLVNASDPLYPAAKSICHNCTNHTSCIALATASAKCDWMPGVLTCTGASRTLDPAQCAAFAAIYDATNGKGWLNCNRNRLDPCSCTNHIFCITEFGSTSMAVLDLSAQRLIGTIPSAIGALTSLTGLNFWYNNLTGTVPSTLASLTGLTYVSLNCNDLQGTVLSSLEMIKGLGAIGIDRNNFTGTIPSNLGSLPLRLLAFGSNSLTGTIPASLGFLTGMTGLELSFNRLTGTIPSSLGSLTKLRELDLNGNRLTGTIPSSLGSLRELSIMYLYSNKLTGLVPPLSFAQQPKNCALDVYGGGCIEPYCNHFKCPLPAGIDACNWRPKTGGASVPGAHCEEQE
jgi:hypothetical protein